MFNIFSEFLVAARTLLKARAFTAVCVTSLGVGMGVVILILLFTRSIMSTPPGVNEDGLVELVIRPGGQLLAQTGTNLLDTWSYPDYLDVREGAAGLTVTGWSGGDGQVRLGDDSPTMPVSAMYVSSNYFSTVGVPLPLGPGFTPASDASIAAAETVIGHRMWQVHFDADPRIIGRTITVNHSPYVVVGVAPERFRGHVSGLNQSYSQLWLPLSRHPRLDTANVWLDRDVRWVRVMGKLPPGGTLAAANGTVAAVMASLAERHPSTNADKAASVEPYFAPGARIRANSAVGRMIVYGLTSVVLLVVCLNISGMMLVRSAMRERELAIRVAIGATRWRLARQHLTEALVLAGLRRRPGLPGAVRRAPGHRVGAGLVRPRARPLQA